MAVTVVGLLLVSCSVLWMTVDAQMYQCYECNSLEMTSGGSTLRDLTGGGWKTDPTCQSNPSNTVNCPSGAVCGYMDASGTVSVPLGGRVTTKLIWRGCIARSDVTVNQCVAVNREMKDAVKILSDATVDGQMCSCDTDMCDAGCSGFNVRIAERCLSWWIFVGVGGGLLVLLISCITCCCCCCCGCCRSKPTSTYVHLREPGTVVVTNTHLQTAGNPVAGADMQAFPPSYGNAMSVDKNNVV